MDQITKTLQKRYNDSVWLFQLIDFFAEKSRMSKWRKALWKDTKGKILEVGVGIGTNIRYYPDDKEITAIDFSEKMLEKAKERAALFGKKVDFRLMDIQNLSFPDETFDTVVSTCVFCSIPDPVKGLQEIMRVCKQDGRIFLLEHVRSNNKLFGLVLDLFNPIAFKLVGANINRNTVLNLTKAGLRVHLEKDLMFDIVKHIECGKGR